MAELNYSIDLDLKELRSMVDSLVPYIYEDQLYGNINIDSAKLTPGAILLRLRRRKTRRTKNANARRSVRFILRSWRGRRTARNWCSR